MIVNRDALVLLGEETGFRPAMLEKVIHLMGLLESFSNNAFLSDKVVLKGGTALNLFVYDLPRLSVDIDINYIGSPDRGIMLQDRELLIDTIEEICTEKGYISQKKPVQHAGGKWVLRYNSQLQGNPRIEVDLNFITRVPLWDVQYTESIQLGDYSVSKFPVLDKHELSAGKLVALLSRSTARDLYDSHIILRDSGLDIEKLRTAFIIYGAMSREDWRYISAQDVKCDWVEFKNMLIPMLRKKDLNAAAATRAVSEQLLKQTRQLLQQLLPLRKEEQEFLTALLEFGELKPELLTADAELAARIRLQPGLSWKALNVRKHKGLVTDEAML